MKKPHASAGCVLASALRALLLLLALGGAAWAQERTPDEVRVEIETAAASGDTAAAIAILDRLLDPATTRDRATHVEAAKAAMTVLPPQEGGPRAARLLVEALRMNPAGDRAWRLANELRQRALRETDLATGIPLLEGLASVYPAELSYRSNLALLHLDAGRLDDAYAEFSRIVDLAPSESEARYRLAFLEEERGRIDAALEQYDEIIALRGEMKAHRLKVAVLRTARAYEAAEQALAAATAAAQSMALGPARDRALADLARERQLLDDDMDRRRRIRELDARLDRLLTRIAIGWGVVLAGGLLLLRRRQLI